MRKAEPPSTAGTAPAPLTPHAAAAESQFVRVSLLDGRAAVSGARTFAAGHRLPRPDLPVDDGIFAAWNWTDGTLAVENDRYGMRPLFYSQSGRTLIVSPSIRTLLSAGVPATLDDAAIAVFLRLNYFIGDDTPFAAIRALPPACRLLWKEGRVAIEERRPAVASVFGATRDEAIDGFLDRFLSAVGRRLPGSDPVVLPLSGGRDSRHILFALDRLGVRPGTALTIRHYPPRRNDDEAIAAQLVARFGLPHVVLGPPADRLGAERLKNVLTEFCSDEHVQFLPIREYMLGHPAVSYDGIAGDTLTQSWPMPERMAAAFEQRRVDDAAAQVLEYDAPGFENALTNFLTPEAARRFNRAAAMERMREEVSRHVGGPNGANAFIFWNRTRREVGLSPYGLLGFLPRVFAPFLDADVFDFMMSLPAAMLMDRRFQVDALIRAYPGFADIPLETQSSGAENAAFARRLAATLLVQRRWARAVRRRYVVPRALAAAAKGRTGPLWFLPLLVWLEQIEAVSEGRGPLEG